jgi:hypothetical protein
MENDNLQVQAGTEICHWSFVISQLSTAELSLFEATLRPANHRPAALISAFS